MPMDRRCTLVMLLCSAVWLASCKSQPADERVRTDGNGVQTDTIAAARPPVRSDSSFGGFFRDTEEGIRDLLGMDEAESPPVDRLTVLRYEVTDAQGAPVNAPAVQTLEVDLQTGRVSILDADGRRYPLQLSGEEADALEATMDGRRWLDTFLLEAPAHPEVRMEAYIYEPGQDAAQPRHALWSPSHPELPEPLAELSQLFYRAHRMVHPLSDDINLLAGGKSAQQAADEAAAAEAFRAQAAVPEVEPAATAEQAAK